MRQDMSGELSLTDSGHRYTGSVSMKRVLTAVILISAVTPQAEAKPDPALSRR